MQVNETFCNRVQDLTKMCRNIIQEVFSYIDKKFDICQKIKEYNQKNDHIDVKKYLYIYQIIDKKIYYENRNVDT